MKLKSSNVEAVTVLRDENNEVLAVMVGMRKPEFYLCKEASVSGMNDLLGASI